MTRTGRKGGTSRGMPIVLATALAFGVVALLVVVAGLHIPMAGTGVVTDPREIFTTIGAALTGPLGGLVIGVLAGIKEPGIPYAGLLAHVGGGVFVGWTYKKLLHDRLPMPWLLGGWAILVLVYYYVLVVPLFAIGQKHFYQAAFVAEYSPQASVWDAVAKLGSQALPEALFTALITTLILLALPARYRRPLW